MTRLVFLSDSHNYDVSTPVCDILIHAGDATMGGSVEEFEKFAAWFAAQNAIYKIYVPGNHDTLALKDLPAVRRLLDGTLLVDEEVTIEGLRIYGSPWTPLPGFRASWWAYGLIQGTPMGREKWAQIPEGLDILVTHGPPWGVQDAHFRTGKRLGDPDLLRRLTSMKTPPTFHVKGHIHTSSKRIETLWGTTFINASICDESYDPVQKPLVLDRTPNGWRFKT